MSRLRTTSYSGDPRVKPPYGSVEVDWGHPLAEGLFALFLFNEGAGRVNALGLSASGTIQDPAHSTWINTKNGPGINFDGTTNTSLDLTANVVPWNIPAPFSAEVWFDWQSGDRRAFSGPFNNRVASQNGFQLVDNAGSTTNYRPHLTVWNGSAESYQLEALAGYDRPFNKKFLFTYDGSAGLIYVDGVSISTNNTGGGFSTAMKAVNIGAGYDSIAGTILKVAVYKKVVSANNARWSTYEPFAMVRPIIRRRYFIAAPAAAPGGETVFRQEHVGQGIGRGVFVGR